MNTTALINRLLRQASTWTRTELLAEINIVQQLIFAEPSPILRIFDSNGEIPIVTTTSGVRVYELSVANYTGVSDAAIITEIRNIDGSIVTTENELPVAFFTRAFGSNNAKITFDFDPKEGEEYQVICYKKPTTLTTESIHLTVPDEFVYSHLYEGVIGRLEQYSHGDSNNWNKFLAELLPDLRMQMGGESSENVDTNTPVSDFMSSLSKIAPKLSDKELIVEINAVQDLLLDEMQPFLRVYDQTTGKNPVLSTTPGVYVYELTEATFGTDIWKVSEVESSDGTILAISDSFNDSVTVRTVNASGNSKAMIYFNFDPSGQDFYVECYKYHNRITSRASEFTLPAEYINSYLFEGVVARIEQFTKEGSVRYQEFLQKDLNRLKRKMRDNLKDHIVGPTTAITKLIDKLKIEFTDPKVTRKVILSEINAIQQEVFSTNMPSRRIVDALTGKDPLLTTTAGVYEYELNVATIGYDIDVITGVLDCSGDIINGEVRGYGLETNVDYGFRTLKATATSRAKVIFNFNPSGGTYYISGYSKISEIENENDYLGIPDDLLIPYVYEAVAGRLIQYANGGSRRYERSEEKGIMMLRYKLDMEAGSNFVTIEARGV